MNDSKSTNAPGVRIPAVQDSLDLMARDISELMESVGSLEDRLSAVLSPIVSTPSAPCEPKQPDSVAMVVRIRELDSMITRTRSQIISLLQRLEV